MVKLDEVEIGEKVEVCVQRNTWIPATITEINEEAELITAIKKNGDERPYTLNNVRKLNGRKTAADWYEAPIPLSPPEPPQKKSKSARKRGGSTAKKARRRTRYTRKH